MGVIRALTAPERRAAIAGLVCALVAAGGLATKADQVPAAPTPSAVAFTAAVSPSPSPPPAEPTPPPTEAARAAGPADGVAVALRTAELRAVASPTAPVVSRVRRGILLPVSSHRPGFYEVLTPCEVHAWVAEDDVRLERPARVSGLPMALQDATIVLDPGHGGSATGAVGPAGHAEKEANSVIVAKLARLLERPPGGGPRVVVTRPDDFDAGLAYRAAIANRLRASAFLSVHNNAEPDGPSDRPGTETYYQFRSTDSKRLAGLAYEEVVRVLSGFQGVSWMAERDAGAKYRLSSSGGDYYGVLRRTSVPSSIVEIAFISNAPEEQLLLRDDVRQSIAEALYRAVVRYVTTRDTGSGFVEPYPRKAGPSGAVPNACTDPA